MSPCSHSVFTHACLPVLACAGGEMPAKPTLSVSDYFKQIQVGSASKHTSFTWQKQAKQKASQVLGWCLARSCSGPWVSKAPPGAKASDRTKAFCTLKSPIRCSFYPSCVQKCLHVQVLQECNAKESSDTGHCVGLMSGLPVAG
eukprot:1158861-Pelagomonas_calceolata.AAC.1